MNLILTKISLVFIRNNISTIVTDQVNNTVNNITNSTTIAPTVQNTTDPVLLWGLVSIAILIMVGSLIVGGQGITQRDIEDGEDIPSHHRDCMSNNHDGFYDRSNTPIRFNHDTSVQVNRESNSFEEIELGDM